MRRLLEIVYNSFLELWMSGVYFSMFSWRALPQFLSLAYQEAHRTHKKIHQTFGELVFLSSDH